MAGALDTCIHPSYAELFRIRLPRKFLWEVHDQLTGFLPRDRVRPQIRPFYLPARRLSKGLALLNLALTSGLVRCV